MLNQEIYYDIVDTVFEQVLSIIKCWDVRGMPIEYSIRDIRSLREKYIEKQKTFYRQLLADIESGKKLRM